MPLRNRLAVAPMTRRAAMSDGCATEQMARYYASFARGGFALVITEGIYTDEEYSQAYHGQPGLATHGQAVAWRAATESVQQEGGRIVVQLMHGGALTQGNSYRGETIAPSALQPRGEKQPSYGGHGPFALPRSIALDEIPHIVDGFAASAYRALEAGFDGVEVHGGNGYLIDQFLSEATNRRDDDYGGPIERRVRFLGEVLAAVRRSVGAGFLVGVRLSQSKINNRDYKWFGGGCDAATIFAHVAAAGADYIHVSERDALASAFGAGPTLAALAREHGRLAVIANGKLDDPERAEQLRRSGDADLIALARGALANMDWPQRVAEGRPLAPLTADVLETLRTL